MKANQISKIKTLKDGFILTINENEYPIDSYFYESLLPYVGKVLEVKDMLDVIAFSAAYKPLKKLYKYIFNHSQSAFEIKEKLRKQDISEHHIKLIINKLKEEGYLKEDDFIAYHKAIFEIKKGKNAFKTFLESKHISKEKIEIALLEFNENEDYAYAHAHNFIKNKVGSKKMLTQKLYVSLSNKGFSKHTIQKVIESLSFENEDDNLIKEIKKMKKKYKDDNNKIIYKLASKGYNINKIRNLMGKMEDNYEN